MKIADVNGITLRYETEGTGKTPIVFINSLGTNLAIWDDVVPMLRGVQLVRYDKRGHGLSDAPPAPYSMRDHNDDLLGLLDHLEIERAVLIGISVGGMIALDFESQHPDRVEAMVLMDTAGKIGDDASWNGRIDTLNEHGMDYLAGPILDRWFSADADPQLRALGKNMLTRTPLAGYTGTCAAIRDCNLQSDLQNSLAPTLVLCGSEDSATPPNLVVELANSLPNAVFQKIEGAGHLPCWEKPAETANAIRTFLKALQDQQATLLSVYRI